MRGSEGVSWGVPRGWDPGPPRAPSERSGLPFGKLFSTPVTAEGVGSKEAAEAREAVPGRRGLPVRATAAVRLVMAADLRAVQAGLLSLFIISCCRKYPRTLCLAP